MQMYPHFPIFASVLHAIKMWLSTNMIHVGHTYRKHSILPWYSGIQHLEPSTYLPFSRPEKTPQAHTRSKALPRAPKGYFQSRHSGESAWRPGTLSRGFTHFHFTHISTALISPWAPRNPGRHTWSLQEYRMILRIRNVSIARAFKF